MSNSSSTPRPKILIADANSDTSASMAWLLGHRGLDVQTASDGVEALDAIRASRPQAAMLSIALPKMDGYAIAAEVRRNPETATLPLIAYTGFGREEEVARAYAAGFNCHVLKPASVDVIVASLASVGVPPG